jgi:predicted transposase YdaD
MKEKTMSNQPQGDEHSDTYVLIWREPSSPRLRTWVDETSYHPLALPLADITPPPSHVITTKASFDAWLTNQQLTADDTAAVRSHLVTNGLGWELTQRAPERTPSPA